MFYRERDSLVDFFDHKSKDSILFNEQIKHTTPPIDIPKNFPLFENVLQICLLNLILFSGCTLVLLIEVYKQNKF